MSVLCARACECDGGPTWCWVASPPPTERHRTAQRPRQPAHAARRTTRPCEAVLLRPAPALWQIDIHTYIHTYRVRQTDRQADRQTDRQTDKQMDRQTGRQTDKQMERQKDRKTIRQTDRQTDRQADRQRQTGDGRSGRETDRKADRQTDRYLYRLLYGPGSRAVSAASRGNSYRYSRVTFWLISIRELRRHVPSSRWAARGLSDGIHKVCLHE